MFFSIFQGLDGANLDEFRQKNDVETWNGFCIQFCSFFSRFWLHFGVKNRCKINVKSMSNSGSILGAPRRILSAIDEHRDGTPGWPGKGRVRVEP